MVFKYQPTFLATVFLIYSVLLSKVSRQALFSYDKFIKQPEHQQNQFLNYLIIIESQI